MNEFSPLGGNEVKKRKRSLTEKRSNEF